MNCWRSEKEVPDKTDGSQLEGRGTMPVDREEFMTSVMSGESAAEVGWKKKAYSP